MGIIIASPSLWLMGRGDNRSINHRTARNEQAKTGKVLLSQYLR
jgi:hypothetical protein